MKWYSMIYIYIYMPVCTVTAKVEQVTGRGQRRIVLGGWESWWGRGGAYTQAQVCTCMYRYTQDCVHTQAHTHMYRRAYQHKYTQTLRLEQTRTHTCIHRHMYTHKHSRTYIHTLSHTLPHKHSAHTPHILPTHFPHTPSELRCVGNIIFFATILSFGKMLQY